LHYKYSEKKINNTYFDDIDAIQSTIGIRHLGATFSSSASDFNCLPCLSVCSAKDGFALGCGHFFCRKCWSGHISASVIEKGNECLKTMCMADKCGEALTMRMINELAPNEVSAKWRRIDLINFVTSSTSMTWCPSPGCGRAFECIKKVDIISCSCGMRFCVLCSNPAHSPIDCKTLEKWQAKNSSEEENIKWILVNTKKCPGCSQRIEKGLGCAHMTCNVCRYEFCWLCLGDYRNHTTCNTYKVQELASSNKEVKASLDKYLWYYERSNNHGNAAKFAEKDRLKTSERLRKLQNDAKFDWTNNDFLEQAADILIECRYSLKYSYALGFFMDDGPEKNLFEYLQGELEVYTERLSGFLEAPLVEMSRPKILDNCVAVRQFLKNLEDGIKRGLTNV
jgi:ariadne-1